ncbi:MAG: sulfur carrier protein ThiS [Eggerthellaceae bacterium]|nr:sulfur carrier protein ThiS [Eggerthellaceae bacterium]
MIDLTVSGVEKTYEEGITIADLIGIEQIESPEYATVAVNEQFVAHADFGTAVLHDGDVVEFLYFMGGGR